MSWAWDCLNVVGATNSVRVLFCLCILALMTSCSPFSALSSTEKTASDEETSLELKDALSATREHYWQTATSLRVHAGIRGFAASSPALQDVAQIVQQGRVEGIITDDNEALMVETALVLAYYVDVVARADWPPQYVNAELHRLTTLQETALRTITITDSAGIVIWAAPSHRDDQRGVDLRHRYPELLRDEIPMVVESGADKSMRRVGVRGIDRPRIILVDFEAPK